MISTPQSRAKRLLLVTLAGLMILCLAGCTTVKWTWDTHEDRSEDYTKYCFDCNFSLAEVNKSNQMIQKYGEGDIIVEQSAVGCSYEDGLIGVFFLPTIYQIDFRITNKTDHSIRIIWDETVFLNENSSSHKVMHAGTKYAERNNPQVPSLIPQGSTLEDMIFPTDYVYYIQYPRIGKHTGWHIKPLLLADQAEDLLGKRIGVLLSVQADDMIYEYTFVFEVVGDH